MLPLAEYPGFMSIYSNAGRVCGRHGKRFRFRGIDVFLIDPRIKIQEDNDLFTFGPWLIWYYKINGLLGGKLYGILLSDSGRIVWKKWFCLLIIKTKTPAKQPPTAPLNQSVGHPSTR